MNRSSKSRLIDAAISAVLGAAAMWAVGSFLISPSAQAAEIETQGAAIGKLNGQVQGIQSQQASDEKIYSQGQTEIDSRLTVLETNMINLVQAYGLHPVTK